ncbi:MAG: copper resistance protein CopB [Micavibrio sp.]|nr:copper resistance protein CopB [Micavibrio sp.]
MRMMKPIAFTLTLLCLSTPVLAQMDHSAMGDTQEQQSFDEPEGRNLPADYQDVETSPVLGEPIQKYAQDGQAGAQENFGVQLVHDNKIFYTLMGDRLEHRFQQGDNAALFDIQAWVGGDYNKLWLKTEGEYNTSKSDWESTSVEALYSRNISSFWDVQAGYRHDFIPEADDRDFAALGVQGLAPYWFEVEATSYVSDEGDVSAVIEAEYDLLLSQRLILQPRFETELVVQDVEEYNIGSGITGFETGLRLRYEFSRKFAPYVGVSWEQATGATKDLLQDDSASTNNTAFVTGIKLWF